MFTVGQKAMLSWYRGCCLSHNLSQLASSFCSVIVNKGWRFVFTGLLIFSTVAQAIPNGNEAIAEIKHHSDLNRI